MNSADPLFGVNQAAKQAGKEYNAADPESVKKANLWSQIAGDVDSTAKMNQGTFQAQKAISDQGQMTPEQIAARSMEGVDKSSQLASPGSLAQQTGGLGGAVDQGMQAAIANRQNKLYSSSLNNISQAAKMGSSLQAADQRRAAMAGMQSVEALKTQAANTQLVKYQNDQSERNALLNSILNLGGSVLGLATGIAGAKKPAPANIGPVANPDEYGKMLGSQGQ